MNHGRFGSDVPETAEPEKMPGSLQKKVSILSGQTQWRQPKNSKLRLAPFIMACL